MIDAYPLQWPVGKPRTKYKETARFGSGKERRTPLTIYAGLQRLRSEVEALNATGLIVSSNLPIRKDGLPLSSAREPQDGGIAAYFMLENQPHCLACDKWDRVADNMAAIAAHIDAIRGQARWGVGDLAQAFAGYKALSAVGERKPWWQLLNFKQPPDTLAIAEAKWRELIAAQHPDKGGNGNQAAETNAAFNEAKAFYKKAEQRCQK